ncbi:MAG: chemotaxis-specific protein-glutamate methyltransferase CheB [Roseburia sp.]|nr:chemotaxis-specific protein-glutamate methyltransferase CheB [Roseburia sp.]
MSDIIEKEADLCVADTAENGKIAVDLLSEQKTYDLILLDINMPKMDGIGFLKYLNENNNKIPTLMVSSIASRSTKETMKALELGAYDFVKKPAGLRGVTNNEFREQLLEKIHCAFKLRHIPVGKPVREKPEEKKSVVEKPVVKPVIKRRASSSGGGKNTLLFIASSTGGPKALQSVVPKIPAEIGCPVVIVQHMPSGFTQSLAERLDEMSPCKVVEAQDGDVLKNGVVYVAKGGYQLYANPVNRNEHQLLVKKDEPRGGLRPCADIFLESLLDCNYEKIFCAVLTGMGSDGTKGLLQLKKLKEVYTVGQSEESCVVYGMPRAAAKAEVVDRVADLQDVAELLIAAWQQNGG